MTIYSCCRLLRSIFVIMGDCQTPKKMNDNPFSCHTIPNMTDVKVITDENVEIQKECEYRLDGNDIVLTDNFFVDLLSRDSDADAKENVVISVANKELGNSILSNSTCVSSDLEHGTGVHKTMEENMEPSVDIGERSCIVKDDMMEIDFSVADAQEKVLISDANKELGNSIFSNSTCVSSDLEHGTGVHKTMEENVEPSVDVVERSCIVKDVREIDFSVADAKEKVLISVANKEQSNNSLISNLVTSDDKHEIVNDECNSRTTLESGIQRSVEETVPSECINAKVLNTLQTNMTDENKLGNSIFSNSTPVSSDIEHGTGVHKTMEENMEPSVDIVERSCIVKDLRGINCEIPGQDNSQISDLADSLKKSEDETVKEILVQETPKSNIGEEQSTEGVLKISDFNQSKYRCESDIWTDDDDGSSTSDSSSSDSSSDFFQEMCEKSKPKRMPFVKTKGELSLDELPPIEDLVISVNESEMTAIGKIYAVVETLVVIRSMKGLKALDLDSVLFLSHDQPLGRVFDVFGPVNEPFYSVRFNTVEKINEKGVKVGVDVFFAPEKSDITTYVFVEELQNQKGSDASWKHNNEPPEEFLDYSDDEKEKNAKRQRRFKNRNRQFSDNSDVPAKRSFLSEDSSNYIPPPKPVPQWNRSQNIPHRFARPNPFQSYVPSPSPSPTVHSYMSPVRMQNSFGSSPNQPQRLVQPQNIMYRPSPHLFVSPYQQPHHVFGQLTVLNHLSPAFHTPPPLPSPVPPLPSPVMNNIPTLVPASHFSAPQNYFNQTFTRSPSPITHNQHMSPDPWLSNIPHNSTNVPPSHPLTVQIPNMGSPSLPMHQFPGDRGSVQQFVNIQNGNYEPFVNNRNFSNFPPVNVQPRFYHS